jgi:hypothetical protein
MATKMQMDSFSRRASAFQMTKIITAMAIAMGATAAMEQAEEERKHQKQGH